MRRFKVVSGGGHACGKRGIPPTTAGNQSELASLCTRWGQTSFPSSGEREIATLDSSERRNCIRRKLSQQLGTIQRETKNYV